MSTVGENIYMFTVFDFYKCLFFSDLFRLEMWLVKYKKYIKDKVLHKKRFECSEMLLRVFLWPPFICTFKTNFPLQRSLKHSITVYLIITFVLIFRFGFTLFFICYLKSDLHNPSLFNRNPSPTGRVGLCREKGWE